ncbi:family 16 glycosylhydrolase [Fibrobacter sp.]|uniref:family 16 glycosylhydrolase n=1 Tax=Fibrobacter sp. TaxID=35828 RepID=UPI00388CF5AD
MKLKTLAAVAAISAISMGTAMAKDYSGAELYTKKTFQYGKFEARMQMAAGNGLVSSMFLYHNDSYMGGNEPWVEVDIEILGKNPNEFQSNIISGFGPGDGQPDRKQYSEILHALNPAADAGYHTYCLEWTPDYISWKIDNVEVRRTKKGDRNKNGHDQVAEMVKPQGLRFNLWASEDPGWVGPWNDQILPRHQYINWVKVYDYTPGQGENGTDFKLKWVDDFDDENLDDSKWATGDWSFAGNRVDLSPYNVTLKDGALIISITKAGQEGFNGTVPKDPADAAQPVSSSSAQQKPTSSSDQQIVPPVSSSSQADPEMGIVGVKNAISLHAEIRNSDLMLNVPTAGDVTVEIMNALGKVQMNTTKHYDSGSYMISVAKLPAGQYFVNVKQGSKKQSLKFMKK